MMYLPGIWIFLYAILLHTIWGIVLLISADPLHVTAISGIVTLGFVSAPSAGVLFLFVAFLAYIGIVAPKPAGFFFLLPQQLVLTCAAFGALESIIAGSFADGVIRSTPFLMADQSPAVLIALLHTLAVWMNFVKHEHY